VMAATQMWTLRRRLDGRLEGRATVSAVARIGVATVAFGGVAYGAWWVLDQLAGRSLVGQLISVGGSLALATAVYAAIVIALRVDEANDIRDLIARRLRRSKA